jgi:magnesium transporter
LLAAFTDLETRYVLANMSPDDRTFLLEELPAPATQKLLNFLSPKDRKESLELLGYSEGIVGRLMSPDLATVTKDILVGEAMAAIKNMPLTARR